MKPHFSFLSTQRFLLQKLFSVFEIGIILFLLVFSFFFYRYFYLTFTSHSTTVTSSLFSPPGEFIHFTQYEKVITMHQKKIEEGRAAVLEEQTRNPFIANVEE